MKEPATIFKHLYSHHPKFWQSRCFAKILSLLPPKFKDHILYIYQKNSILYFVFNHPAFRAEFNYNKKHINEILKLAKQKIQECQALTFTQIRAYDKFIPPKVELTPPSSQCYSERAKGDFVIYPKNKELSLLLSKIKEQIQKNGSFAKD